MGSEALTEPTFETQHAKLVPAGEGRVSDWSDPRESDGAGIGGAELRAKGFSTVGAFASVGPM